ncbi:GIY-YIG nuclease family protein [Paraburkholderia sediminicola]|uniref:GIY-YIG nuclease family protein n=1 Tax=Paraburkholderia sediminicola TaxID=458836 RepID=UPI0038BAF135
MSAQATHTQKKRWYREDDKCPNCQNGRIKLRKRRRDSKLFLGCSNIRTSRCKFSADIPEKPGYVYVLVNPGYHLNGVTVIKIGYTTNTMKATLEQIDKTGVPFEFEVKYQAMVWKAWATMRQAHITLQAKRLNPDCIERDFFVCSIQEAVDAVEAAIHGDISYKAERPSELRSADDYVDPEAQLEPDAEEQRSAREAWRTRRRTKTPGCVYVLINDVYHDGKAPLLKIGYTGWEPQQRAEALYHWDYRHVDYRGVPQRFKVVHFARFERAFDAEQGVHETLEAFRVNPHREFFSCSLNEASAAIQIELDREARERAQREAAEQARTDQNVAQRQAQQLEVHPALPEIHVQPQIPARNTRSQPKIQASRSLLSRLVIVGSVLVAVYAFDLLSDWLKPHPVPASTPAIQKPVNDQKTKKTHGHATKRKKHRSAKRQQSEASAVEPEQQDEMQPPADVDRIDQ